MRQKLLKARKKKRRKHDYDSHDLSIIYPSGPTISFVGASGTNCVRIKARRLKKKTTTSTKNDETTSMKDKTRVESEDIQTPRRQSTPPEPNTSESESSLLEISPSNLPFCFRIGHVSTPRRNPYFLCPSVCFFGELHLRGYACFLFNKGNGAKHEACGNLKTTEID